MMRGTLAIVSGLAVMGILTPVFFLVLGVLGVFPTEDPRAIPGAGWLVLILAVGLLTAVAAGYVTAVVARRRELRHGGILALLVLILGVVNVFAPTEASPPLWYLVGLVVVGLSGVLFGACGTAA